MDKDHTLLKKLRNNIYMEYFSGQLFDLTFHLLKTKLKVEKPTNKHKMKVAAEKA